MLSDCFLVRSPFLSHGVFAKPNLSLEVKICSSGLGITMGRDCSNHFGEEHLTPVLHRDEARQGQNLLLDWMVAIEDAGFIKPNNEQINDMKVVFSTLVS